MSRFVLHHDSFLVGLSMLIAMLASFTTFDMIGRFRDHSSLLKKGWLFIGSITLAIGVWSSHFVGMFASHFQQVAYFDKTRLVDSFLILFVANCLASFFSLHISSERVKLLVVSLFLTSGITGLHYIGMSALQAEITYDPLGVIFSILITLGITPLSLWFINLHHHKSKHQLLLKLGSSAILGLAISAMHYSGMFAIESATFPSIQDLESVVYIQSVIAYGVGACALFMLSVVMLGMYLDRKQAYRQAELSINQYRSLFEKSKQTIKRMATHDYLTGAPNPRMFQKRLKEALASAEQKQEQLAIIFIDLDRFKVINDQFGHIFGDRVMKNVSERLQACLGEGESMARLAGDEFAFLLSGVNDNCQIAAFAQKIMQQFEQAWIVDEKEFHLTPSMGISVYPHDGDDIETLVKHADKAVYWAKKMGKNQVQFFNKEMEEGGAQQFEMENALRKALEQQELINYYQPKIDIHANRIVGMEALIRWIRPDGIMIPPSEFIPLAEETGLILQIGKQVLRQACLQNKKWQDEGKTPLVVSVNISYLQFRQPDFLDTIKEVLAETKLPPEYLELEITEGIAMYDIPLVIQTLRELRRIGIQISIDDFGTGYSSLAYLSQFPIQALKIDKSFIQGAESNPTNKAIILAIMAMAKSLGINIIAEGVEEPAQLSFLREHGCHVVQGYFYSPPIPAKKFEEFIMSF